MAKFWDDFSKWLDDASKVVSKEAGDLTLRGKLKLEMFELKRNLKEEFNELGRFVYEAVYVKKQPNWRENKKVQLTVRKIRNYIRQLKDRETNYKKIG